MGVWVYLEILNDYNEKEKEEGKRENETGKGEEKCVDESIKNCFFVVSKLLYLK